MVLRRDMDRDCTQNTVQIFTYDKETEERTGALTKMIFAGCFPLLPILIGFFGFSGTSLLPFLLSDMFPDQYVFYPPYISTLLSIVVNLMLGLLVPTFFIMFIWILPAIYQLLRCYCVLEDGRLVMLEWRPRRRYCTESFLVIAAMKTHLPDMDSSTTRRGVRAAFGLAYGMKRIQNKQWVLSYLTGEIESRQVAGYIVSNITVLKESKSRLVILADMDDGDKVKRRKLKIYRMYHQMEEIKTICEKGGHI